MVNNKRVTMYSNIRKKLHVMSPRKHHKKTACYVSKKNLRSSKYPTLEELLNRHSELVSKYHHSNK